METNNQEPFDDNNIKHTEDGAMNFEMSTDDHCALDYAERMASENRKLQSEVKRLREALKTAQMYLPGVILTMDMGQCCECGESTSSGMLRYCRRCIHKFITAALNPRKE